MSPTTWMFDWNPYRYPCKFRRPLQLPLKYSRSKRTQMDRRSLGRRVGLESLHRIHVALHFGGRAVYPRQTLIQPSRIVAVCVNGQILAEHKNARYTTGQLVHESCKAKRCGRIPIDVHSFFFHKDH